MSYILGKIGQDMKTLIIVIAIVLMFTGIITFGLYNKYQRVAIRGNDATVKSIETTVTPTNTPTPTIYIYPTATPTIATPTIAPTVAVDKTKTCENEAQLKKMQLKEQLAQIAVSKLPAGSDWSLVQQGMENEAQKAYLQIYNMCLAR